MTTINKIIFVSILILSFNCNSKSQDKTEAGRTCTCNLEEFITDKQYIDVKTKETSNSYFDIGVKIDLPPKITKFIKGQIDANISDDHSASIFFFFNDTPTSEIYTLSLHDALPICAASTGRRGIPCASARR